MELDFQTVKALSSPTRLAILRNVLEKESTPTQLSTDLEKSKSTVSSHLKKLTEAGLLEKDEVEGRKRVTYQPTRKAQAIVEGRERKVKFSIASSAVTSIAGAALVGYSFLNNFGYQSSSSGADIATQTGPSAADAGDSMGVMSKGMESAANASENLAQAPTDSVGLFPEEAVLYMGVGLLGLAAISMLYGVLMNKLGN